MLYFSVGVSVRVSNGAAHHHPDCVVNLPPSAALTCRSAELCDAARARKRPLKAATRQARRQELPWGRGPLLRDANRFEAAQRALEHARRQQQQAAAMQCSLRSGLKVLQQQRLAWDTAHHRGAAPGGGAVCVLAKLTAVGDCEAHKEKPQNA
ncbi:hypothetical protein O3P69_014517 [Scylla paramamosain]|uniref:Uncharacterized protein n=1 Tax=Scylla paramamosain TaxID=85552 RepID=A0AAW0TBG7_SCYPA